MRQTSRNLPYIVIRLRDNNIREIPLGEALVYVGIESYQVYRYLPVDGMVGRVLHPLKMSDLLADATEIRLATELKLISTDRQG